MLFSKRIISPEYRFFRSFKEIFDVPAQIFTKVCAFKKFEYEYMHQKTNSVKYDDEPGAKVHGALRSIVYEADTLEF